jgi:hypothetical protein
MTHSTRLRALALAAPPAAFVVGTLVFPRAAMAATFDERGVLRFDADARVTESFEGDGALSSSAAVTFRESSEADGLALHGNSYAVVNTTRSAVQIPLALTDSGSYRARFFARTNRVLASVVVSAGGGRDAAVTAPAKEATFFPTGRVTSDGWYEVETAPFSVDAGKGERAVLSLIASGADVDALEVVAEGGVRETKTCTVPRDSACGAGEFCASGFCRDGDAMVPALPPDGLRAELVAYLDGRLENFFGGRYTRAERLPVARAALAQMREAKTAWAFWNAFATAIHRLADWHTKIEGVDVEGRGAFPICFVEGDADLSHDLAPKDARLADVLVSHVGPEGNSGLKPGDRLVAVNGMHPIAFVESLDDIDWGAWRANDPEAHGEAVERMRIVIRRFADTLTVIRCDAEARTCTAPETIRVRDLPRTEPQLYPQCDHRPRYHIDSAALNEATHFVRGVAHGPLRQSQPGEDLFGMVWDSVYLDGSARNPYAAAIDAIRASAKGVVLDHRTGNGGTEPAAEFLTQLFRSPAKLGVATGFNGTVGLFDAPFSREDGLKLFRARESTRDAFDVGSTTARNDLRAALLLARDGSASDWYPKGMKGADNVRLFGRRTSGAFSSFLQFDYFGGIRFQFASGDFVTREGETSIGFGVVPDEEILPKQSDLLVGRDTVFERALEWVRSGQ